MAIAQLLLAIVLANVAAVTANKYGKCVPACPRKCVLIACVPQVLEWLPIVLPRLHHPVACASCA